MSLLAVQGKFVSYADFPPVVGVQPPSTTDFIKWRKRWRKQLEPNKKHQESEWWAEYFDCEFWQAPSEPVLYSWGKLLGTIKFAFDEDTLQELRESYRRQGKCLVVSG